MILHGDLFDILPTLAGESLDAGVVDPPYGIGMMGKEWDTFKPGSHRESKRAAWNGGVKHNANLAGRVRSPASSPSQIEYDRSVAGQRRFQQWTMHWAREVWLVLKPGAYLLVCGAPRSYHRMICGVEDAGFEVRDCLSWNFGQGFPKSRNLGAGRGTGLKPGWEPILVARKPFRGSLTRTLAAHGCGALNVEACRLELLEGDTENGASAEGRWPPNVIFDEEAAVILDASVPDLQPGGNLTGAEPSGNVKTTYNPFSGRHAWEAYGDRGGASRFFYVAKASRAERDLGCEDLVASSGGTATNRKEGSAGLRSPRAGAGRTGGGRNIHPTVKPLALMRWLVRLVTPPGGTVLDCFCGSGTTGMAARLEQREFIGIEREAAYVAIAERRIAACAPLFDAEESSHVGSTVRTASDRENQESLLDRGEHEEDAGGGGPAAPGPIDTKSDGTHE